MTLEQFERFVDAIDEYHKREELFCKALEPFNSSYTVIDFCSEITFSIIQYIDEYFNDESSWFSYWFYELEQGEKYFENCAIDANGKSIKLKTKEDLYNLLMEKKNEQTN